MNTSDQTDASQFRSTEVVATLHGVIVTFDSFASRAVNAVSLQIIRGEVFALVGPKQSGKSTILRLLAGQVRPTEGKVKVFGRSLRRWRIRSRIGYLPQLQNHLNAAGLLGWLNKLFESLKGRRSDSESISPTARHRILARLFVKKPDLLLLDEPFSGLEPESCLELKTMITALAQQGKTVVVSSSSLSDVCGLCHRLAVLYHGEIQATGTLGELLTSPDAIRFTGPVLPQPTAERVLKIIREDLEASVLTLPQPNLQPNAQHSVFPEADSPVTVADRFLAPLAGMTCSKPISESPITLATDAVDHKKLAELVKPNTGTSGRSA